MDKESRLGKFNKWGYKNSFSKGELARELTYMNRDYEKLEQQCKKQKEVIDNWNKLKEIIKKKFVAQGGFTSYEWNDLLNDLLDKMQELEKGSDKE